MLRSNLCQKTLFDHVASHSMHCVVHCLDSSEVSVSGSCAKYSQRPPAPFRNLKHLFCGPNNVCQCNCRVRTGSPLTFNTEAKMFCYLPFSRTRGLCATSIPEINCIPECSLSGVECHVKQDTANQPNLLNKLTATVGRKWELVVVLNGINSLSGVTALGIACGNFLHVLKKFPCP